MTKDSPLQINRLSAAQIGVDLAKYRSLAIWQPKVSDFIIYHGWIRARWYGIVSSINDDEITIIKDGLPKLLFTMPPNEFQQNSVKLSASRIRSSRGGEYHILQGEVWYVDE